MGDGEAFDVVGIGALNLDYIVTGGTGGVAPATAALIAGAVRRLGITSEPGTETAVSAEAIRDVLAEADALASPTPVLGGSALAAVRAMSLAEAGLRLGFVGVAGDVPVARHPSIESQVELLGVDRSFVRHVPGTYSGICFSFPEHGDRTLLTHAGANARMAEFIAAERDAIVEYLARARIVHVTSFLDEVTAPVLVGVLREVRRLSPRTRFSFDPGHVWSANRTPAIDALAAMSDYLLLNDREFRELAGGSPGSGDRETAAAILSRAKSERTTVMVKRPDGILVCRQAATGRADGAAPGHGMGVAPEVVLDVHRQTPLAPDDIVDATNAGDVFAAGLLTVLAGDAVPGTEPHVGTGVRLGMRLARRKLRHVGFDGAGFAGVVRTFLASADGADGRTGR